MIKNAFDEFLSGNKLISEHEDISLEITQTEKRIL